MNSTVPSVRSAKVVRLETVTSNIT